MTRRIDLALWQVPSRDPDVLLVQAERLTLEARIQNALDIQRGWALPWAAAVGEQARLVVDCSAAVFRLEAYAADPEALLQGVAPTIDPVVYRTVAERTADDICELTTLMDPNALVTQFLASGPTPEEGAWTDASGSEGLTDVVDDLLTAPHRYNGARVAGFEDLEALCDLPRLRQQARPLEQYIALHHELRAEFGDRPAALEL